jgi:hypothetical protein
LPRLAEGEFALVWQHLEQAGGGSTDPVRWGSAVTDLDFHVLYADAAARAHDAELLARFVPLAEQGAEKYGHRLYSAIALRARGVQAALADQAAEAVACQDRALSIFEGLGTRYQIGLTLTERARALAVQGNLAAARADWSRAATMFDAVGAVPAARLVRDSLAALGDNRA